MRSTLTSDVMVGGLSKDSLTTSAAASGLEDG